MKNTLKIQKSTCFDGLELKSATFQNKSFPAHFHDTYAIAIIQKGIETLNYGKNQVIIPSQNIVVINPYDMHSHAGFDTDLWQYSAFYLSPDIFNFILKKNNLPYYNPLFFSNHSFENPYCFELIQRLFSIKNEPAQFEHLIENICLGLFQNAAIKSPIDMSVKAYDIEEAKQLLSQDLTSELNLDKLSDLFRMDKFRFLRKFKRFTGMTPIRFQMIYRISKAKSLLRTDMPLTDISFHCGFYDQSHFIHCFKKYEGFTPLEYRLFQD